MAQTQKQLDNSAREWAHTCYVRVNKKATLSLSDIKAAVNSIDATMDMLANAVTGARTIKQNILDRFPEPFKSTATAEEKARALIIWAQREAGL